ncbi:MAG: translocation/assembly module TamB domain-containing protein [Bacteroidetes bacterium]|nr:translocation/assembly module TamB domain-containing protein [Bacteroidota bacterium]MBS1756908.1 translocation/assembly module TamB domain-containing protein [Bacteroidota bacterium]
MCVLHDWLFLQIRIFLQKSITILKWFCITLAYWLALAALYFFAYNKVPLWIFIILIAGWATAWLFTFKKTAKKIGFFAFIIILVLSIWGLVQIPSVQNWMVAKVTKTLSEKLHTTIKIENVSLSLFNKVNINGLLVDDLKKDTLLYAGTAKVNITDWFFLKDKISFHYLELDDALINLHRSDSVWNYQFLIDYFSGPKTGGNKKSTAIELKEIHLNNIRFNKIDKWIGQDMNVALKKMDIQVDSVNLDKKQLAIKEIYLEQPLFAQSDYTGSRPAVANLTPILQKIPMVSAFKWNNDGWICSVKKFQLFDGSFKNDKETDRPVYTDRFDGQHLLFNHITGSINNVLFLHDTLTADISLAAKERSGLDIKKLQSKMKFTPELMEFNNLALQINNSKLGNYYAMHYNEFNNDFSSFLHNVTLNVSLTNSSISSDDLAIFSPNLKSWNRVFEIQGSAKGSIDNFSTKNIKIKTGNTIIDGDIAMRGLPDINSTFIDFKSNFLQTNYADLTAIIPQLKNAKQVSLSKLGTINYTGYFTGFIRDFVAYGNFNTGLGGVTADLNMKIPENGISAYSGKIATNGFNIGSFLNASQLGIVTANTKIKGRGFSLKNLNANVDATVKRFDFNGYSYQNAIVNGDFDKQLFKGHLSIDDPNLKISGLDGALNISTKQIAFNLNADVAKANLKNLLLTNDNLSLSGLFSLNFTGNNIDNFLGTARINDATLKHDSTKLSFDSLTLKSEFLENKKLLTLQSNELEASINGQFKIMELPDAFTFFLSKYYPSYFTLPKHAISKQDFTFNIKTHRVDEYVRLFDKKLSGFNHADIKGSVNIQNYQLRLDAAIPEFIYDKKTFTNTTLQSIGNKDTLNTQVAFENIAIDDSLHFPLTKLLISAHNNVSLVKLNTTGSKIIGDAELNATIQSLSDGVKIHFYPSSFVINNKKWQLEKDGEITLRKKIIDANEVKFFHDKQQIVISTELDELTDNTNLVARLSNVDLDFLPIILKEPKISGLVTGTATLINPFGNPILQFDGNIDSLSLDNKNIGRLNLNASANTSTGIVNYKAIADNPDNQFMVNGFYNYKDTTGNQLSANLQAGKLNLDILQPYLSTIFSQMSGTAQGNIKVYSGNNNQYITGDATISNGALKIAYTQCKYLFDKQTIHFGEDLIDIGTIKLKDTLNNEGVVSGKMHHHFFKDFSFENMRFETQKMLLLNTTKKDNQDFYGNVTGRAIMTLRGPVTNLQMNIDGAPSSLDSSHIYLPTGNSRENNSVDYLDFIQFGSMMDKQYSKDQSTNIVVNLNLTANPACKVDVILDEETNDVIKGQGNGQLAIRVGNKEPLSIRGKYNITNGEYTFNFQTFLNKPFTLNEGSSITWNGDPYAAQIDIAAEYLAKNVNLAAVSQINNGLNTSGYTQKDDINIIAHLTGSLKTPKITFDFKLPETSEKNKDYILVKRLDEFKNDENEMNKQVASLLLFNTFITQDQNFLSQDNTIAFATSTIGGAISGFLTNTLNRQLEKATKGVISSYIDINPTVSLQKTASALQANIRAGLKILLSNRLNILIGGNLDYNDPYALQSLDRKGLFTPDITIEWILNNDGSLRVVGFNRTSVDITTGQRNRSGVQLSYRKDFDKIGDLFKSRKKIRAANETKVTPINN